MLRTAPLFLGALFLSVATQASAHAQWTKVQNPELGIRYKMPKDLRAVPANKARPIPHLVDRWESIRPLYIGNQTRSWDIRVWVFRPKGAITGDSKGKTEGKKEDDDAKRAARRPKTSEDWMRLMARPQFTSFAAWVEQKRACRQIETRAKSAKQRGGARLAYERWEWKSSSGVSQSIAGCYRVAGAQVAIVGTFPSSVRKKLQRTVLKAIESLAIDNSGPADAGAKKRKIRGEEHADVDEDPEFSKLRKKLLDDAIKSVENMPEWDVFATPNYIVLYSFDDGKQGKARSFAYSLAKKMDEMNAEYRERFPPHDSMKRWWPVLRICRNKSEFDKYGGTSGGVVGWYNSLSKELVVFNAKKLGLFKTDVVAYHEGWHQYADFWFPGAHLHRWFDEGTGDFFGSMKRVAPGKFRLASSKMRKETIQRLVRAKKTVPLREIVRWHKSKFYSARATDYYAQGWAMIDFFTRGPKTPYWKRAWDKILPTYIQVALETKDTNKAVDKAYAGVDWDELEEAFASYVKRSL